MTTLTTDAFAGQLHDLFVRSAFRLELLDTYVAGNEREPLARFLAGEHVEPGWDRPWAQRIRVGAAAGKSMSRVHVVTEPPSDYVRFELAVLYPANAAAGEDVRILPRQHADQLQLPQHDFWLFDDRLVAMMSYDDAGNWLSVDLTDDPEVAAQHCRWRDLALTEATPFPAYDPPPRRHL